MYKVSIAHDIITVLTRKIIMTKATSTRQVLKKIGCDKLDLFNGGGYYYFAYDDPENNIFETESVITSYLNQLTLEMWVEIGQDFVKKILNP